MDLAVDPAQPREFPEQPALHLGGAGASKRLDLGRGEGRFYYKNISDTG